MTKLQTLEREMKEHRQTSCAMCRRSVTDVAAPACPIMLDLNQRAREAARKARR